MDGVYESFDEQADLLTEKGYLTGSVKSSNQVGYWLREFEEEFDRCCMTAHMEDGPVKFMMPLNGKFNDQLQNVRFEFRYEYDPRQEKLSLLSLYANLGRFRKTYEFKTDAELPSAQEVYQTLNIPIAQKDNLSLYVKLFYDFQRDRNPENDHKEEPHLYRPPKLRQ